jgi:hypothetical protein
MNDTLDDVRRPLRLRWVFVALAFASLLLAVVPYGISRVLWDPETRGLARAVLWAGLAWCVGHAVISLWTAALLDVSVRRDEEAWARRQGATVLLVGASAIHWPLFFSSIWYWDADGVTTFERGRHAWADLQSATLTRRRADTVLNALWGYTITRMQLRFASGLVRARLDTSNFGGADKARKLAFEQTVTQRFPIAPVTRERRGLRWTESEHVWQRG